MVTENIKSEIFYSNAELQVEDDILCIVYIKFRNNDELVYETGSQRA